MRDLIITQFMTLDGVTDSPGGGDHPHAGWTFQDVAFDEAAYALKGSEQEEAGALLVGRQSWEEFHQIWPTMTDIFPLYNAMPKYVVSTTLDDATVAASPWQPMTVLRSIQDVAALKETDGGPLIVHGSQTLAQSLAADGLVDRYHLLVFPLVLGAGKRLFAPVGDAKQKLTVRESETYANGITKLVLDVVRD
jgi:dihydrofolate reductase